MMNDLKELLNAFADAEYKPREIASIFISNTIDEDILKKFNITFEKEAEGTRVDLFQQTDIKIFKTKQHFYTYIKENYFSGAIGIIEDKLLYKPDTKTNFIFDNVKYSFKIFNFIESKISAHKDISKRQLILLSEKMGKDIIGYEKEYETNLTKSLNLPEQYKKIENANDDFLMFFKNSILDYISLIENEDRYIRILENFNIIYQNAKKDFDLYKSKFSFKDFQKGLESEKQKYIKDTQNFISDFSSKIDIPIQFGIYVFLVARFSTEIYPLLAIIVIIVSWSFLKLYSIHHSKSNIEFLKKSYEKSFDEINNKLGNSQEANDAKKEVTERIKKIKKLVQYHFWVITLFSLSMLAISIYLLYCLF